MAVTTFSVNANSAESTLEIASKGVVSNSVKWTQESKEYSLIVDSLYRNAADDLRHQTLPNTPWLVIMDVDETLLNNSQYNLRLEQTNTTYSNESWRAWVQEKHAKAIPGAVYFVKTVLALGGQLALVTNRNQLDDQHTWKNLVDVGFPITAQNTCLVGRRPQDKSTIDNKRYINDKDLRREEFTTGAASLCWNKDDALKLQWNRGFNLLMQVGDNIEDVAGTTQKNASIEQLLKRQGRDILILPNAMYGSWGH